nr:class I SAM-dependent methyltransferase [Kibdelosporangium sp. MJ126-NF4]CEL12896.1 Putative SAM-dependent methyltransferases [Kibdelosporangium sp. MJ126-NF4]CTQ98580.1 Putative SAM-dependent methyltransferases [Kibdelosporangium sp. MJ126-NF4]
MTSSGDRTREPVDQDVLDGIAVYNRHFLAVYDICVYGVNMPLIWRCPTSVVRGLYDASLGAEHLELGVGSGYLLARCQFPVPDPQITLVDLNPTPLAHTARRLARYRVRQIEANLLAPLPVPDAAFDSVGLNLVLHCLPGSMREKGVVLAHAAAAVRPGGVVFGSTLLSGGVRVSLPAKVLMRCNNAAGVFHNEADDIDGLRAQLSRHFASHTLIVRGNLALFRAHRSPVD